MNSSFKIKEPSHYYNLGVPSYQRLPFPQDHKIKLFIQPYLNGHKKESSTVSSTTSSKLKTEKLFVEPYALSIVSKRVSKPLKKEVDEGYNVVNVEEETTSKATQKRSSSTTALDDDEEEVEMIPVPKKRRIIKYSFNNKSTINSSSPSSSSGVSGVSSPSSKDKVFKSQFSSVSDKRMKESESSSKTDSQTMIKLSNGQFIRVPQSMLVNIELFKQKSQALTVSPVIHQTSVSLSSPSCESIAKVVVKEKKAVTSVAPQTINVVGSTTITTKQPMITAKKLNPIVPSTKMSPTIIQPVNSLGATPPIILSSLIERTKTINLPKTLNTINASSMIAKKSLTIERPTSRVIPSSSSQQQRGKSLSSIVVNSQSPQSHIIALKTHEKNGQVIYLKSVPNPKSPTPGATRLIVAQPQPNQRLTTTNIQQVLNQTGTHPGVQLPLKLVNQPASSIEGISTTPRNPVIVKRLIPSDLPRLNSQVNKGKPCSNSVGSPLNGALS
ncbi:uncharacterized protein [Lepeophtheirus salmonis]|uniref:Uncharacterized protein n=1 Tax=Lepeophtheirus salmonis TaxID=72036 RepID=A0A0K2UT32_LEPSM|nr:uncharacterized protein LOC121131905 [Lepeophtheirus salmonis]